jgi:signal transduction histidine kinase
MDLVRSIRSWAERHPDAVDFALGVTVGLFILVVSLTQWGATDTGLSRGVSLGLPFAALTVWAYRRRRRNDERRERASLEQRLLLARELHDSVAGQVAIVGIQAAAARRVLATRPDEAAIALERIEQSSRAAVGDLRRMLTALRQGADGAPPAATPGLRELPALIEGLRRSGLDVDVTNDGSSLAALPPAVDHAAYRIIQEALTNALKHGSAKSARVEVAHHGDALELRVTNPIRPVPSTSATDQGPAAPRAGLGVTGLRERAGLFGGEVFAGPTTDSTWLVDVRLPIQAEGEP